MASGSNRISAKQHPAETVGLAGAIALIFARLLGVTDPDTVTAMAIIAASLPAGVTYVVNLFGLDKKDCPR